MMNSVRAAIGLTAETEMDRGRRDWALRRLLTSAFLVVAMAVGAVRPAFAVDEQAAVRHVVGTIDEVIRLMTDEQSVEVRAAALLSLIERRAAPMALARYLSGDAWKAMSEGQRRRFTDATMGFAARIYARQFRKVTASREEIREVIHVLGTHDAGRKGLLVMTEIRPPRAPVIRMDFLVSDRTGRLAVIDLIIQGLSMAVTHREVVLDMLRDADGDVERVIEELSRY